MMNEQERALQGVDSNVHSCRRILDSIDKSANSAQWDALLVESDHLVERAMRIQRQAIRSQAHSRLSRAR